MRGAVLYGPRDIRFEDRETPKIMKPTDAIIRISATCVCGSDLWPYRGIQPITQPTPMGHELVRHWFILRLRQLLPQLPDRLSVLLPARGVRRHGAGTAAAGATR